MIKCNIVLDTKIWIKKIKKPDNYFKLKLKKLSKFHFFRKKNHEFTILLTNNNKMKKLNLKFRNKNKITDVLSFPLKIKSKNKLYVGDIAISFEIINKRSKSSFFDLEFDKMWIHGYLHLIGYDHKNLNDYKKMLKKEKTILNYIYKKIDK
jgi:probable rRNA maturation factor